MQELKRKGYLEERASATNALKSLINSSNINIQTPNSTGNQKITFSSIASALKLCPNQIEEPISNNESKLKVNIWKK